MTTRRLLIASLVLSIACSGLPAAAAGVDRPSTGPIRASVDRAIAETARADTARLPKPKAEGIRLQSNSNGGGGGHAALLLLGLAASAATTYFVVKAVQKQTKQLQTPTPTQAAR
jgi:hypothetical protein